ncbi:hypothetical protein RHMOL_Rhmol07G0270500 [Rhododendron molle]|uniref:Uncharacterized protein n=1 Tax=Rhododendron molle TaxID=49168 RepID=A0ACC0N547_RHOML|nr:hypothetical protein RHMOL_Rhmol07G0270500 [Rhododendron molle]
MRSLTKNHPQSGITNDPKALLQRTGSTLRNTSREPNQRADHLASTFRRRTRGYHRIHGNSYLYPGVYDKRWSFRNASFIQVFVFFSGL